MITSDDILHKNMYTELKSFMMNLSKSHHVLRREFKSKFKSHLRDRQPPYYLAQGERQALGWEGRIVPFLPVLTGRATRSSCYPRCRSHFVKPTGGARSKFSLSLKTFPPFLTVDFSEDNLSITRACGQVFSASWFHFLHPMRAFSFYLLQPSAL